MGIPLDHSFHEIASTILHDGGITIEWGTGRSPEYGFAVAPAKTTEVSISVGELTADIINSYTRKYERLLIIPGMCFGARMKDGLVYLDVSLVVPRLVTAAALATESNQFAIRCLHESRSIPTEEAATTSQLGEEMDSENYLSLTRQFKTILSAE